MLIEAEITNKARSMLESLLASIPFVNGIKMEQEIILDNARRADFIVVLNIGKQDFRLVGEVKKNLQPRYVLDAIRQVKEYCYLVNEQAYPVVVSDYISPRSAEILNKENVSYFDLVGNCRLCFANIYIEKEGKKSKAVEKRGIKSLFGLKSSRMLRLMLKNPVRLWQVKELAARTELSFGQVSNIRRALLDQNYAIESEAGGFCINQPAALLSEWKNHYKKSAVTSVSGFYSLLSPADRLAAVREAIVKADDNNARIMLSGLSAARWQAPFSKSISETFYADKEGQKILEKYLMLERVNVGPNIIIEEPKDPFIFKEATGCAPGLKCTDEIQTYLDLYISGEREREVAEHIESQLLSERWSNKIKDVI